MKVLPIMLVFCPLALRADCIPMHRPCWMHCTSAPKTLKLKEAGELLRRDANRPLHWWQTKPAFLFTPFKRLGVSGWRDYCLSASFTGEVVQSIHSTDGFQTVDFRIRRSAIENWAEGKFIRVEIMPSVHCPLAKSMKPGDRYTIKGELVWDCDAEGWLEIHPRNPEDIMLVTHKGSMAYGCHR